MLSILKVTETRLFSFNANFVTEAMHSLKEVTIPNTSGYQRAIFAPYSSVFWQPVLYAVRCFIYPCSYTTICVDSYSKQIVDLLWLCNIDC